MKRLLFFIVLSIESLNSFGQSDFYLFNRDWLATVGYTYQNQNILEVGMKITTLDISSSFDGQAAMSYMDFGYLILGGEMKFNPSTQFAPKIGVGYSYILANINLNLIAYNSNFKEYNTAFVPEAGLSLLGLIQINYGYNFYISSLPLEVNHRISVRINIPVF